MTFIEEYIFLDRKDLHRRLWLQHPSTQGIVFASRWPLFSIFFGAMITFFPVGAWRGTVEPNNPRPLWPPRSLFTLLLIQHQMVMDSHRTSMESVFSTRQCLWGTQMEANVVVSAFRLCRLTGRDHRDTRKRMSHRYLTGGEVKQDAYCRYMGRWRHSQGVALHLYNIGRLTVLRCKGNWYNRTRGIFFSWLSNLGA